MSQLIGFVPEEDYLCYGQQLKPLLYAIALAVCGEKKRKKKKNDFMHGSRLEVILMQDVDGTVLLDLFPTDWHSIVGPFRSKLPSLTQPDFFFSVPVADLLLVRFAGSCELFAYTLLLHCCMGFGVWLGNPGFGGFRDWGDIRVPGGLLGWLCLLSLGPIFSYGSITDFTTIFLAR